MSQFRILIVDDEAEQRKRLPVSCARKGTRFTRQITEKQHWS